jgi:hypothetical protein
VQQGFSHSLVATEPNWACSNGRCRKDMW